VKKLKSSVLWNTILPNVIIQYYWVSNNNGSEYYRIPNVFWREQQQNLPILAKIAKSIYVIQASSAESERHFSTGGQIVTQQRSQLDPECVESLVVLKEAYLNNN
ncbi:unnamed protein product, partial [Didymodactylos carnosus]